MKNTTPHSIPRASLLRQQGLAAAAVTGTVLALMAQAPVQAQALATGAGSSTAAPASGAEGASAANAAAALRTSPLGWQACQALSASPSAQLACFQDWAAAQTPADTPPAGVARAPANPQTGQPAAQVLLLPTLNTDAPDGKPAGCRNTQYSELSRFWELQRGTDCDTFGLRGYRPISLSVVFSDGVNNLPSSPAPNHTALTQQSYQQNENKIQLSVRTKIAKGIFKSGTDDEDDLDSVWFGYTQQSYWQLFNAKISRPFRSTDHEPELIYIYPHQISLPGGWDYRLTGLGIAHQSNGQSLPLSRSWNRTYLMGAAEKQLGPYSSLIMQARYWTRIGEREDRDDNPGIENYIGRAELAGRWQINEKHTLGLTVRHSLKSEARGSTRLDWLIAPASAPRYTGLRYHVQLFNGYGDSLVDYNRKRTVLSLGFSLVDW